LVVIRIEGDYLKACLYINFPKSGVTLMHIGKHLGFDVDLGTGYFIVPTDR